MSKRKAVRFAESAKEDPETEAAKKRLKLAEEGDGGGLASEVAEPERYESKHTLESDEEEEEKYDRLDMDRIEGQEDETNVDFDGDTKLTPFNMKDEQDDGHFDSSGNFIFNKKNDDLKDEWMDGIDWGKVKKAAGDNWEKRLKDAEDVAAPPPTPINRLATYAAILTHMQPRETVTKTLKRLGGGESAADARKRRWEAKKAKKSASDEIPDEAKSAVDKFTELIDGLVTDGVMEAYGFTYEKLSHEIAQAESARTPKLDAGATDDDALDAFGDDMDEGEGGSSSKEEEKAAETTEESSSTPGLGSVSWEFMWEEGGSVQGPCSSAQMAEWQDAGYFKDGIQCRKAGDPSAQFYSSARIDFDLYT